VQEEDDDIGDEQDHDSAQLNRRGSRSEGRISLTVQERLAAESERMKKEQQLQATIKNINLDADIGAKPTQSKGLTGISGVKIIKNDAREKFLGQAGLGVNRKEIRSTSVDKDKSRPIRSQDLKILTDSSTIPAISVTSSLANQISIKPFKTMPSPTNRPLSNLNSVTSINSNNSSNINNTCLMEIFEEMSGSSDNSNTNTPRSIFRTQAVPVATNVTSAAASHQRRTKFHKSRTTSNCSSSDDDDQNAEKKRVTKIIDGAISKQFTQRRDSDSSDSQDPSNASAPGSDNACSTLLMRNGGSTPSNSNNTGNDNNKSAGNQENRNGKTSSNGGDMNSSYRRHRTGRRKTETRLRESQSLNRITEVQECEVHNNINSSNGSYNNNNNADKSSRHEHVREEDKDEETDSQKNASSNRTSIKVSTLNHLNAKSTQQDTIHNATNELKANKNQNNAKAKGFSARFLQNLNFKRNNDTSQSDAAKSTKQSNRNSMPDVPSLKINNNNLRSPIAQMSNKNNNTRSNENSGNDRPKKIKILGRYFQVSRIIMPLLDDFNCLFIF
jgi:SNF-related kinase